MKVINFLFGLLAIISFTFAAPAEHHAGKVKSGTTSGTRQVVSVNPTQWFLATKRAVEVDDLDNRQVIASIITTFATLIPHQALISDTSTTTDCITCITGPAETYEVHGPTGSVRSSRDAAFRSKLITETWLDCAIWVTKSDISKLGGTSAICASALASDTAIGTQVITTTAPGSPFGPFESLPCWSIFGWANDPTCRASWLSNLATATKKSITTTSYAETTELPDCPVIFGCMNDPVSRSSYYSKMSSRSAASASSSASKTVITTTTSQFPETTELPDCPVIFGCMDNPISRSSYYSKMSSKSAAMQSSTSKHCTETPEAIAHTDAVIDN